MEKNTLFGRTSVRIRTRILFGKALVRIREKNGEKQPFR